MNLLELYSLSFFPDINQSARIVVWLLVNLSMWGYSQAPEPGSLQAGLGVSGDVSSIHGSANVAVGGDVWQDNAEITGDDKLILASQSPQ